MQSESASGSSARQDLTKMATLRWPRKKDEAKSQAERKHKEFHAKALVVPSKQVILIQILSLIIAILPKLGLASEPAAFPGVARELHSFCSARPSLPVDLATMIVHVKRNTSFNYKLYLFSGHDYVFQTGQIVPRDDFRVHAFPVKMKRLSEFWPSSVATYRLVQARQSSGESPGEFRRQRVGAGEFELAKFFQLVAATANEPTGLQLAPNELAGRASAQLERRATSGAELAGERASDWPAANEHIQFDRDDQVSLLGARGDLRSDADQLRGSASGGGSNSDEASAPKRRSSGLLMPVGAFSSFHVNTTYLVRKDFGQSAGQLIRIQIDAHNFQVAQVELLSDENSTLAPAGRWADESSFLGHKLLRDPSTRITSINQIYEDWITRNFYTIVYVQRRLLDTPADGRSPPVGPTISSDRLVFRGSSAVLLGADQLEQTIKASAFITEKNGLHYYLEFLASKHAFQLAAVDWSKRPFKVIDSQAWPMQHTRTVYDNEELLLCPPALCYSRRPLDELVAYGRLELEAELQEEASILSTTSNFSPSQSDDSFKSARFASELQLGPAEENHHHHHHHEADLAALLLLAERQAKRPAPANATGGGGGGAPINLVRLVGAMQRGARALQLKLHLRDWTWLLERRPAGRLLWRFEAAKRNELKASRDTYGFALSGHEIDASFRVYNQLYLISNDQLIAINYTQANRTQVSSRPLSLEFAGLSSTLVEPITGAFYERHANQLFFFKGDRYVGYDYATKRPLDEFQLAAGAQSQGSGGLLVASLPVVAILGRQHQVDAVYHELLDDRVYIITGEKFYSFAANDFKDGAFQQASSGQSLPKMRCINQHLLLGCQFDAAYPNPCRENDHDDDEELGQRQQQQQADDKGRGKQAAEQRHLQSGARKSKQLEANEFGRNQQSRLRAIAAGRQGGLFDLVLENTLLGRLVGPQWLLEPGRPMVVGSNESDSALISSLLAAGEHSSSAQERIVMSLLVAMVAMTILITGAMLFVVLQWAKVRPESGKPSSGLPPPPPPPGKQRPFALNHERQLESGADLQLRPYASSSSSGLSSLARRLDSAAPLPPRLQQVLLKQQTQKQQQQQQHLHYATGWLDRDVPVASQRQLARRQQQRLPPSSQFTAAGGQFGSQLKPNGRQQGGALPAVPKSLSPDEILDSSAL